MALPASADCPVPTLGTLSFLPKEIRQEIYGHVIDLEKPFVPHRHPALGPCKWDGESTLKLSGYLLRDRMVLLTVSKAVNEEFSWVFYNRATVTLRSNVLAEHWAEASSGAMWQIIGCFQHVEVSLAGIFSLSSGVQNALNVVMRYYDNWLLYGRRNSGAIPSVTIHFCNVFSQIWHWFNPVWEQKGIKELEQFIWTFARYRNTVKWTIVAQKCHHERERHGVVWMAEFGAKCRENGIRFETEKYGYNSRHDVWVSKHT